MLAIYGRLIGKKRYKILGDGALQDNKIYGEYYPDFLYHKLMQDLPPLHLNNPDYEFKVERVKGTSLFPEDDIKGEKYPTQSSPCLG